MFVSGDPDSADVTVSPRCVHVGCGCERFLEPEPGATAQHPYLHKGLGPKRVDPFAGMPRP